MDIDDKLRQAEELLVSGNLKDSLQKIFDYLSLSRPESKDLKDIFSDYKAGCLLIDIGDLEKKSDLINKGIYIIDSPRYDKFISKISREYNLGNGKKALFDAKRKPERGKYGSELLKIAIQAKNHYMRCLNSEQDILPDFKYQILVNAANALDACGRPTEALFLYNQALSLNPKRFEAHASKSTALKWLNDLSGINSEQMKLVTKYHLEEALKYAPKYSDTEELNNRLGLLESSHPEIDEDIIKYSEKHRLHYKFSDQNSTEDYIMNNSLYLSHHSCYCSCIEARNDNIIGTSFIPNRKGLNRKVILLRLIRRIVNEYIFARNLLYKNLLLKSNNPDLEESLRASYRICYGTLDKIARVIVLSEIGEFNNKENLIFESFWRNKPIIKDKSITSESYNLFALYSIATDLELKEGELRFFKEWRNAFEHSLVVITNSENKNINQERIITISKSKLLENLPKLLRVIRSAIFSTVFLLKEEKD